jgi:hypothetical protein
MPDNQRYLCSDKSVAERHSLKIPFECGCRVWVASGIVKVDFYSNRKEYRITSQKFQANDYANIKTLTPIEGTWTFDPSIEL